MACVRLTGILRQQIRRNAENAFNAANPTAVNDPELQKLIQKGILQSKSNSFLKSLYETQQEFCNEHPEVKGQIQKSGLKAHTIETESYITFNDITRNVSCDNNNTLREVTYPRDEIRMNVGPWVLYSNDQHAHAPRIGTANFPEPLKTKIEDKLFDRIHAVQTRSARRRSFINEVQDLLNDCTTVHQFLEVWPGGEYLIPSDAIQKMHIKVTRAKRAAEIKDLSGFDPSKANQVVLTAKILGA